MDDKSKDLENMNSDNGCVGSGRRILKVTQTKGLITSERGNARSSVVGKEAITATSESVHIPPQRLEDDEEYSTGFTEEISKKDFSNSENLEGEGTTQVIKKSLVKENSAEVFFFQCCKYFSST
ncbi:unnamed protein product [Lepeophtheirus salmonis]|uniref:(salmon louse) hypothetical protein n=1 Tax=Lepeophtheirus salmonis TaxID=72036 RepID=A0A7R8HDY5_LEPSM|nr:unnamed protein product [Lepeophtheirus salmonis]CAF3019859.1 unnamed protein product [Lepeophtheirus salmonis]